MPVLFGIDIGGTFTDFVIHDPTSGETFTQKLLTTPAHPEEAVLEGLREILAADQVAPSAVKAIAHATTLATNAIIERQGARIGFITTKGFRDVVVVGSEHRYDMQDIFIDLPRPLVARRDIREVDERIDATGVVVTALDPAEVKAAVDELTASGCEVIAIGFLHSYRNAAHEAQAGEAARGAGAPFVSVSHEIAPVIREYGRFSTTLANAYVQPLITNYTQILEEGFADLGLAAPLLIMLSDGGLSLPDDARAHPVRLVESGPAAGVMAAAELARALGRKAAMSFDMGGTTAKGAIILDGKPAARLESEVARLERFKPGSGLPLVTPTVDLIEIGAGGGSIAWVDAVGRLQVGPRSSGSNPGPACYGLGGGEATVTDADLLLGFLNPEAFAGTRFRLDAAAAGAAVERLAKSLGVSVAAAAWGINAAVDGGMASAFRIHAIERGVDVRVCPMIAFGGAGPVHATAVAELLGIREVIYPRQASVYSAVGLVHTPPSFSALQTFQGELDGMDMRLLSATFAELEADCRQKVARAGADGDELAVRRSADIRYRGQVREVEVPVPNGELNASARETIRSRFGEEYRSRFSQAIADVPIEIVNCRVSVYASPATAIQPAPHHDQPRPPVPKAERTAVFELGTTRATPVHVWDDLTPGQELAGPCLIESTDTVAVIRPGWRVQVDAGVLLATREGDLS